MKKWGKFEVFFITFGIIENCILIIYFDDIYYWVESHSPIKNPFIWLTLLPILVIIFHCIVQTIRDLILKAKQGGKQ